MAEMIAAPARSERFDQPAVAALWIWIAVVAATLVALGPSIASTAIAVAAAIALAWIDPRLPLRSQSTAIAAAAASWPIFFLLRTNVLNQDGHMLTPKFERDVPLLGAHLSHDELLELFLHAKVWEYTTKWWGWSVVFSYQVVSCVAGALFVYLLVRLSTRLAPERTWLFLAGVLSGGYMQLFFGDVENYTVTASLVAAYVLSACRCLEGEAPLWVPAAVLAAAMCFHLEAAWLLPTTLYLAWVSRGRTGDLREAAVGAAAGAGIIAAVFVAFHFYGLPLWRFASTHAGHALRGSGVFAFGMPSAYYVDQVRLLFLLCPAVAMLIPLAVSLRGGFDHLTIFLGVGAASMLVFQAVWKAANGVFDDWNLYAIGAMFVALFIWRYAARTASTGAMRMAAAALAAIGALHSYAWIVMNHRAVP